jgi:hypothetical protein
VQDLFIKVSVKFFSDDKIVEAGPSAGWLFLAGLCYSKDRNNDGFVPTGVLRMLAFGLTDQPTDLAEVLVATNLWERCDGGFRVAPTKWAKWQTTAEQIEKIKASRSEAGRLGAEKRWRGNEPEHGKPMAPAMAPAIFLPSESPQNSQGTVDESSEVGAEADGKNGKPIAPAIDSPPGNSGKNGKPMANAWQTMAREERGERREQRLPIDRTDRGQSPLGTNSSKAEIQKRDLSGLDWNAVTSMATAVAKRVPPRSETDRRQWLKYAVIAELDFGEAWLIDAAEAVLNAKQHKRNRQAHFVGLLKSKLLESHINATQLKELTDSIEIPIEIWNSEILEIRK